MKIILNFLLIFTIGIFYFFFIRLALFHFKEGNMDIVGYFYLTFGFIISQWSGVISLHILSKKPLRHGK